jgi:LacI family transcriptional regulator
MPTIIEVAARAGISPATGSHTLNGTRVVEPATRERVWGAASEPGYWPNALARGFRRRETLTIGLITPDNANPSFTDLPHAVEDAGFATGDSVVVCNSDHSAETENAYVDVLLTKQVDGIILASPGCRPDALYEMLAARVPIVVVPGELGEIEVDLAMTDDESAGYLAGDYLVRLRNRAIGCIAGPRGTSASAGRVAGRSARRGPRCATRRRFTAIFATPAAGRRRRRCCAGDWD